MHQAPRSTSPLGRPAKAVLAASVLALGLAACGGSSTSQSTSSSAASGAAGAASASTDLKATLTYGLWDQTQVPAVQKVLAGFNAKYPGVKVNVNVTPYADYWTKLQTQASSKTLPDVFWMNGPNFQLYAANKQLAPITDQVKSGAIDPTKYPKALDDLYTLDGVQYGVPKDFDTIAIWANTALFKEAGVALPTGDWTWQQFQDTAKQISDKLKSKGIYGAAAGMDGQTTYYDTIFQAGGTVVDGKKSGYDSAASQQGIQFWTDLIKSGASPSVKQLTDTTADQWFTSGKLAMYQGGSWFRSALTKGPVSSSVKVLPLPMGKQKATVIHGVANVVAASSKNKEAAQALQDYFASQEAEQTLGSAGSVIPAYTGTQSTFAASMPGADLQVFLDALAYAKPLPVSANTAAWNALETDLLPDAFSGARPVADVTKELAAKMDTALGHE
ncbi:carbohydrate ABC transporter substrate-binding protein (CUT1 family) [Motilibacter rhizosphaerae]|uniref:Carbohydrate ABC transporter substrate-binding protein (CUT1 family) n=1 Tax=Motilibacter rhizosphaerae TaxID=598652 RepID=A0A4Q7NWE8_9ACTN|nr:sugar ABC transporter substrate-binding protein [Motilibacter rhizosphaerae]RZS91626.1 carbohydrate ABC transporter substrate-binding protein (CUT1 family) [Motilibacter rhizosphaerae]